MIIINNMPLSTGSNENNGIEEIVENLNTEKYLNGEMDNMMSSEYTQSHCCLPNIYGENTNSNRGGFREFSERMIRLSESYKESELETSDRLNMELTCGTRIKDYNKCKADSYDKNVSSWKRLVVDYLRKLLELIWFYIMMSLACGIIRLIFK